MTKQFTTGENFFYVGQHGYGVDDSEIKEEEAFIVDRRDTQGLEVVICSKVTQHDYYTKNNRGIFSKKDSFVKGKIIFSTNSSLTGVPLLVFPKKEDGIEKLAKEANSRRQYPFRGDSHEEAYIEGYKANPAKYPQEEYEQDMKAAFSVFQYKGFPHNEPTFEDWFKNYTKSKHQVVSFEVEVYDSYCPRWQTECDGNCSNCSGHLSIEYNKPKLNSSGQIEAFKCKI